MKTRIIRYGVKYYHLHFFLIISFLLFIFLVGQDFLSGSYSGQRNWETGSIYAFIILRISMYLSIIYFFINNSRKLSNSKEFFKAILKNKTLFIIIISYVFIFLGAGDRGPIMELGLVFLGSYSIFYRHFSFSKLIFLVFIGALIFTIIRFGRTRDASTRQGNIITEGYENFNESDDTFNPTNELASSTRILYRALDVVPERHPYLYGITIGLTIVDILPFGGLAIQKYTDIPPMYTSSGRFFTILKKGNNYDSGDGSEIIADLYVNFGFWITLLIFLFFGRFISYINFQYHFNKTHRVHIIYIFLLITAIYVNRADFLNPLKLIVWALIFDWFLTKKISKSE